MPVKNFIADAPIPFLGSLAADATSLYWTDYFLGAVMKIPLTGGTATPLASAEVDASTLVLDQGFVYFSSLGQVMKVPKNGGTPETIAYDMGVLDLAVDDTSVYWTNGLAVMRATPK